MIWKCNYCQAEIDIEDRDKIPRCPKCGLPTESDSGASLQNSGRKSIHCPHCNKELGAGARFCPSCHNALNDLHLASNGDTLVNPWSRWVARYLIDFHFEHIVCIVVLYAAFESSYDFRNPVLNIIAIPLSFILDSAVYAVFGNTLGKWLFGIKHVEKSNLKISAKRYFVRNIRVYCSGCGFGIPIVNVFCFIAQHARVSCGEQSTYDNKMGIKTVLSKPSSLKIFFGNIVAIFMIVYLICNLIYLWNRFVFTMIAIFEFVVSLIA